MDDSKMSIGVRLWAGFLEVFTLTIQVLMKLGSKSCISCLGEKRFFLKNGKEAHRLLKHVNAFLQIHAKINIGPLNTFPDIFFLLQNKHVLVEELLKLFITEVDANLLKAIVVKDFKASNIQASNVVDFFHRHINNGFITFVNNESEDTLIDRSANTRHRAGSA